MISDSCCNFLLHFFIQLSWIFCCLSSVLLLFPAFLCWIGGLWLILALLEVVEVGLVFEEVWLWLCCLSWNCSKKVPKAAISFRASWLISYFSFSPQQLEQPEQLWELFELVFELFLELAVELAPEPNSTSFGLGGFGKVLELPVTKTKMMSFYGKLTSSLSLLYQSKYKKKHSLHPTCTRPDAFVIYIPYFLIFFEFGNCGH